MRIGIVWTATPRLATTTVRFERYLQGFEALGHEAVIVSTREAAQGYPWAGVTLSSLNDLRDPALWADLRLDAALVVTWLVMPDVLAALRPHVRHVISLADSDGCIGVRVFPGPLLSRMWHVNVGLPARLRATGWWLRQYLWAYAAADRAVLESARLADRIVVYSPGAKENLQAFFAYHREPALGQRVIASPYPVDEHFESAPLPADRAQRVVAIGRWADPQKGASLLAATIRHHVRSGGDWVFVVLGADGSAWFQPLQKAYPRQVDYRGSVGQREVAELLGRSRVLLSTSRWESGPIIGSEALLRGCSVVGPAAIPSFRHFCKDGTCGTTFASRTGRAVADALAREARAWETGGRDPLAIAAAWKDCFSATAVCRQLLAGFETPVRSIREDLLCSTGSDLPGQTKPA
jgi:glycosyltransferase involved in cell wall biosynthesis